MALEATRICEHINNSHEEEKRIVCLCLDKWDRSVETLRPSFRNATVNDSSSAQSERSSKSF